MPPPLSASQSRSSRTAKNRTSGAVVLDLTLAIRQPLAHATCTNAFMAVTRPSSLVISGETSAHLPPSEITTTVIS
jgi:hypothetical protein